MLNAFPSIEAFDRINSYQAYMREKNPSEYDPVIRVRPKIKLHGVNAAFGVGPKGLWVQSRDALLSPDNHLYRAYDTLMPFAKVLADIHASAVEAGWTFTVFGEWAGPGVQRKDAVTGISQKMFFPFMVTSHSPDFRPSPEDRRAERRQIRAHTAPAAIQELLGFEARSMMVMPWAGEGVTLDFRDMTSVQSVLDGVNARSEEAGIVDPFILETFGVEGPGEGFVYAPDSAVTPLNLETYANLTFKAKAERHRVKISDKAAKIATELPADAHEFVETFVTENRMQQMLNEKLGGDTDKTKTGAFVAAVIKDVMKESGPEREALDVSDKALSGLMSRKAAKWFLDRSTIAFGMETP